MNGIRPVSARTRRIRANAKPIRDAYLRAHPTCEARLPGCTGRSTEVHERLSRARGGSISDESNLVALCHVDHCWITEHPAWATEHGWLRSRSYA